MDAEIQFGDLEQAEPEVRLRPDMNKHHAVAAYASPHDDDLPIFVDMEVMREVESHALSDTSVELGGVMLGGQFEDEDGNPFVVVTDSLRAQHYEATKGSFKFTHETWEQISRDRDEFPDDLQMVGWYHTHPDWGVFLSGMDMFICDNFFNKPLDLALVIDPCRDDRGMFQWTPDPGNRVRRTGGFYLTSSRFRLHELELYACQLEGRITMASDSRYSGVAGQIGTSPAPVINISENRNGFQGPVVVGMLLMQFLLVVLIAWRMMVPAGGDDDKKADQVKQITSIEKKIDALTKFEQLKHNIALESQIQTRVLDRIVTQLIKDPEHLVYQVAEQERELALRDAEHRGDLALRGLLEQEKKTLDTALKDTQKKLGDEQKKYTKLRNKYEAKTTELTEQTKQMVSLNKDIAKLKKEISIEKDGDDGALSPLTIGIGVAIVVVLIIAGAGFTFLMRRPEDESPAFDKSPDAQKDEPQEQPKEAEYKISDEPSDESTEDNSTADDSLQT